MVFLGGIHLTSPLVSPKKPWEITIFNGKTYGKSQFLMENPMAYHHF